METETKIVNVTEEFKAILEKQTNAINEQANVIKAQNTANEEIKSELLKLKKSVKINRIITICISVAFVVTTILLIIFRGSIFSGLLSPALTLMSPASLSVSNREEIIIDVVLSDLPDRVYPAASLSVEFDKNKLEFLGTKQGTMMTLGDSTGDKTNYNIPIWSSDVEVSNQLGRINTMYLDITGGNYAYVLEGFAKNESDVLLRLCFKLRDSVQSGEVYDITVNDAVIATVGGAETRTSLATDLRTLRVYHAKIVIN